MRNLTFLVFISFLLVTFGCKKSEKIPEPGSKVLKIMISDYSTKMVKKDTATFWFQFYPQEGDTIKIPMSEADFNYFNKTISEKQNKDLYVDFNKEPFKVLSIYEETGSYSSTHRDVLGFTQGYVYYKEEDGWITPKVAFTQNIEHKMDTITGVSDINIGNIDEDLFPPNRRHQNFFATFTTKDGKKFTIKVFGASETYEPQTRVEDVKKSLEKADKTRIQLVLYDEKYLIEIIGYFKRFINR